MLKKLFHGWADKIHNHHRRRLLGRKQQQQQQQHHYDDYSHHRRGVVGGGETTDLPTLHMPEAKLSNAAQGNYLEVLNICLNLYDKSYINRIFDHTGNWEEGFCSINNAQWVRDVDRLTNTFLDQPTDKQGRSRIIVQ